MVHGIFEYNYSRWLLALVLAVILAFSKEVDILQKVEMYYVLLGLVGMMLYVSKFDDYGLFLLTIALLLIVYNNIAFASHNNKKD
jgi:Na+/H+ antiporter NhaD/arsenite permease-like protein